MHHFVYHSPLIALITSHSSFFQPLFPSSHVTLTTLLSVMTSAVQRDFVCCMNIPTEGPLQCLTQFLGALSGAPYTTDNSTVFAAASSAFGSCVGSDYLRASFECPHTHLQHNVSIIIVCTTLYIIATIIASEIPPFTDGGGGSTVFATKNPKCAGDPAGRLANLKQVLGLCLDMSVHQVTQLYTTDAHPNQLDCVYSWFDQHLASCILENMLTVDFRTTIYVHQ
jgi:hypothetical protein